MNKLFEHEKNYSCKRKILKQEGSEINFGKSISLIGEIKEKQIKEMSPFDSVLVQNVRSVAIHIDSCLNESTVVCSDCGQTFQTLDNLQKHRVKVHLTISQNGDKTQERHQTSFKIPKKESTKFELSDHLNLGSGEKKETVQKALTLNGVCLICLKKVQYMKRHLDIHSGERRYECKDCGKNFGRLDKLKRHGLIHNPYANKFECSKCESNFLVPDKLKRHMVAHSSERPIQCLICKLNFKRRDCLTLHKKKVHSLISM